MEQTAKAAMQARALMEQGQLQRNGSDLVAAAVSYKKAAELWRGLDEAKYAHALRHVADVLREDGKLAEAEAAIAEVVGMYRLRAPGGLEMANAFRVAALVKEHRGDAAAARGYWAQALPLYQDAGVAAGIEEAAKRLRL